MLTEYFKPEFKYEESEDSVTADDQQDVPEVPPGRPQLNQGAPDRLSIITGEWWNYVDCASTAIFELSLRTPRKLVVDNGKMPLIVSMSPY